MTEQEPSHWVAPDDGPIEEITPQEGRDRIIAALLVQLSETTDFRERQALTDQILALNGGEYPTAHQQAIMRTMHHEEDHHDAGPDIPG